MFYAGERDEYEQLISELHAFAHTVAHELKTPLTGILAYSELLQTEWATAETCQRAIRGIEQNGHKMDRIIQELLILAETRQTEQIRCRPLNMQQIVQEAHQRIRHLTMDIPVTISYPERWPVAVGYAPWIEEVWVNYLSNGLKYGGRPPCLQLGGENLTNCTARFWVRDNGPGLSPGEQASLFKPFSRLDKFQVEGNGLGLSIVQRIVNRLEGQVGVESQVGRGCLFYFTLPVC